MLRIVERRRPDANIAHPKAVAERREIVIFGNRWQQHRADRALFFEEGADIVEHAVRRAVDRAHEQCKVAVLDCVEDALLKVQDRLRIGIVVEQRDEEIAAKGERTRLRIGNEAERFDRLLHRLAGFFADELGPVDDAADRLFRNPRERRDIVLAKEMSLTTMFERRVIPPYGLAGGEPGAPFKCVLKRRDGTEEELRGKANLMVREGDHVVLHTSGGGGYGSVD